MLVLRSLGLMKLLKVLRLLLLLLLIFVVLMLLFVKESMLLLAMYCFYNYSELFNYCCYD